MGIFIVGKLMLVLSFTWPFISAAAGLHPLTWSSYAGYLIVFFANWFSCSFWLTLINVPAHLTMDERRQGCPGHRLCENPDCAQQDLLCRQPVHDLVDLRHEHTDGAPSVPNRAVPVPA